MFPRNFERYVEPFAGSAAVFSHLRPTSAVISDTNRELIESYAAVRNNWSKVAGLLKRHSRMHSNEHYYRVRAASLREPCARAARLLYLNRTCFNGVYRVNRQGHFNVPIGSKDTVLLSTDDFDGWADALRNAIQLVSVFVVHHQGKFLTHLRSARLPEQRLHGEYSIMLGGHLATDEFAQLTLDLFAEESLSDCSYILRELSEELILETAPRVASCGYLYDVSREVSKQHLGLVYIVDLAEQKYRIGERGFLMNSRFETSDEIRARIVQFENWSTVLLDNIHKIAPISHGGSAT